MTTASPQGTPHAVDYGLVTSLATSLVFFDSAPDTEAMKSMITQAFGENLGPLEQSEKSLVVEINDEYALAFTPAAATRADLEGDPSFHQHPILSGDPAGWEDIACMVLINVFPSNERLELIKNTREARLHQLVTLGLATSAIAQTPGAIAVLNSVGRVAESTENYVEAVADKLPAHYLASTWVAQDDNGLQAYTLGMPMLGHPELQIRDFQGSPDELYSMLANIADYAQQGATLKDGDTMAFAEGEPPIRITAEPWIVDADVPALRIHF
ncbi:hypothetical protein WM42_0242 [Corynebacterium simulans]|uniref:DUF4261 domain-containing protein n=1 Tax=Corynebacterium simulans TaxID=146827 RepID=UPI000783E114|nr:DUF4261 domain-containing protein [Corynebacterium simulans]AMO87996.1 hypothetical protein WM42_0242 [Corynebacterium simulans]